MIQLSDFIQIYDEVLESDVCNFLINSCGLQSQFNLTENCKLSDDLNNTHNYIISKVFEYKKIYYEFIDDRCFPEKHNFEKFVIYKQTEFINTKVDVYDHETARRFLCFNFFLNTVEKGGEVTFKDFRVSPKQGSLLVFPSCWMFPYKEELPIDTEKFTLRGYLHYK